MCKKKISFQVLTGSNINEIDMDKVKFIATNSTGGMGWPGIILLFSEDLCTKVYAGTHAHERTVSHAVFNTFSRKLRRPLWHFNDMGMGNALYVRSDVAEAFEQIIGNITGPALYSVFEEAVFKTMGHMHEECQNGRKELKQFLATQVYCR